MLSGNEASWGGIFVFFDSARAAIERGDYPTARARYLALLPRVQKLGDEHRTVEQGHGREETRTYVVVPAPETVDPEGQWADLRAVGMAISERKDSKGCHSLETRFYIMSRW